MEILQTDVHYHCFIHLLLITGIIYMASCTCIGGFKVCDIMPWVTWSECSTKCGVGIQNRIKPICCDTRLDFWQCLKDCKIDYNQFQKYGEEKRYCAVCFNGTYNSTQNACQCFNGYTGACCNSEMSTVTTNTTATNQIPQASTELSTTATSVSLRQTNITQATTLTTGSTPTIIPFHDRNTIRLLKNTGGPSNQKHPLLLSICGHCQHGTCIDFGSDYLCDCTPGYEGRHCEFDKDDCETNPCFYGKCVDQVDGYFCECNALFTGKNCTTMKWWGILILSLACACLLFVCVCCFCCVPSRKKNNRDDEDEQSANQVHSLNNLSIAPSRTSNGTWEEQLPASRTSHEAWNEPLPSSRTSSETWNEALPSSRASNETWNEPLPFSRRSHETWNEPLPSSPRSDETWTEPLPIHVQKLIEAWSIR